MKRLDTLPPSGSVSIKGYNELINRVNALSKITGRGGVTVRPTNNGISITGSVTTATPVKRAFVKVPPGSSTDVEVYLDTDLTGTSATVTVSPIYAGGGNLSTAEPDLSTSGVAFYVTDDRGTWRNVTTFFRVDNCP